MTQIKNVPGTARGIFQDRFDVARQIFFGGAKRQRIQVSLNGSVVSAPFPSFVQRDAVVHADHVPPGLGHQLKKTRGARSKMDRRNFRSEPPDGLGRVRQDVFFVLGGLKAADLAVENLHGLNARLDLSFEIFCGGTRDLLHERFPCSLVGVHETFGLFKIL